MVAITDPLNLKVMLVGSSSVGKTCVLLRFTDADAYEHDSGTISTVGVDFRTRIFSVDSRSVALSIWDTAGQEKFIRSIPPNVYRGTHGLILVYDITNRASFDDLEQWIAETQRYLPATAVLMIIGNKVDRQGSRKVSTEEGKAFADEYQALFLETSAKTAVGVDTAFEELARRIMINPLLHEYFGAGSIKQRDADQPNVVRLEPTPPQKRWYQRMC